MVSLLEWAIASQAQQRQDDGAGADASAASAPAASAESARPELPQLLLESPAAAAPSAGAAAADAGEARPAKPEGVDWYEVLFTADEIRRMKECIALYADAAASDEDTLNALYTLEEIIENIDWANDLHTLKGLVPLFDRLEHRSDDVRAYAAACIGAAAQNNPKVQAQILELGAFGRLVAAAQREQQPAVLAKMFYAISSMIRSSHVALIAFFESDGVAQLGRALALNVDTLSRRVVFLLNHLCREGETLRAHLLHPTLVRAALALVARTDDVDLLDKGLELLAHLLLPSLSRSPPSVTDQVAAHLASAAARHPALRAAPAGDDSDEYSEARESFARLTAALDAAASTAAAAPDTL